MDDSEREYLREFLLNENREFPELADLPRRWDMIPPDAVTTHPDLLPIYTQRDTLLASYSNWAFTKRWAWEGLRRLLETLTERQEPIPEILQSWANAASVGSRQQPGQGRGRPPEDERDNRMRLALAVLRAEGLTRETAINEIANACYLSPEAVTSAIRKMERARPF